MKTWRSLGDSFAACSKLMMSCLELPVPFRVFLWSTYSENMSHTND